MAPLSDDLDDACLALDSSLLGTLPTEPKYEDGTKGNTSFPVVYVELLTEGVPKTTLALGGRLAGTATDVVTPLSIVLYEGKG